MVPRRAAARRRTTIARALAALACMLTAGALTHSDTARTDAGYVDDTTLTVSLQSPDLPGFIPGLVLWLDGNATARHYTDTTCTTPIATAGDPVRCWQDVRENGPSVTAATANPPTNRTGGINGRTTVRLTRDNSIDALLTGADLLGATAPDLQIFVVARENTRSDGPLLSLDGTSSATDRRLTLQAPGPDGQWTFDAGTATTDRATTGPTTVGTPSIVTAWKDPTTGTNGLRVNGVLTATSPGHTTAQTTGGIHLGTNTTDHDLAELLIYDRRLTPAQEHAVEAHLAAKWNLPLGATAPTNLAATPTADRTITLTWQAPADNGGSPITDYVVHYRAQGAASWSTLADGVTTTTTATAGGLTVATTYEFRVAATTTPGTGTWSAVASTQALTTWTPTNLPDGLELWLDAADTPTLTLSGNAVTEWRDKSGLGRHATQTDPARRPSLTFGDPRAGGRPTIGSTTTTGTTGLDLPSFTMQRLVATLGYGSGTETAFGGFDTLVAGPGAWGTPRFAMGSEASANWFSGTVLTDTSFANGATSASATALPMPFGVRRFDLSSATTSTWSLGTNAVTPGRTWAGPISEVLAFPDLSLGTADRQRVEGYLAHKWGTTALLPADHPYKTVPPLTATPATAPGAPSAVTAVPGDGALAVSWTAPAANGSPIRNYTIDYRATGATPWITATDGVSTATTATITGLTNNTTYELRVAARNAAGTSAATAATAPATPRSYRDTVLTDSPTAWWRLGEPSGTTTYSETGTGLAMTATGTVTRTTADALAGDADRAIDLAGTAHYTGPNTAAVQSTQGTLEAWVKTTAPGTTHRAIIVKQLAYGLFLYGGVLETYDWTTATRRTTAINIADGAWHHVAMTYRSGVANGTVVYLDGQPVLTTTITISDQIHPFLIGSGETTGIQRITGSVDEAAFYNTVLTADRIAAHHRAGITGTNDTLAPTTPTGLTATPASTQVTLTWNANSEGDLAGYRLFRDGTLIAQQTGTTYTDTGRTNGTTHTYTLEAYDTRGNRSPASAATATPRTVPGAPTGPAASASTVATLAGSGSAGSNDAAGVAATFNGPTGVALDAAGNLYVADRASNKIRRVTPAGVVTTFAGSGTGQTTAVNGPAASATIFGPSAVAVDASGNVWVAEQSGNRVRRITPAGTVSTVAGSPTGASGGADGNGTAATFNSPLGIAVDAAGNAYVAEYSGNRLRKIDPAGNVTTLASGFNQPRSVVVDAAGNLYVADGANHVIKRITSAGVVSVVAGSGTAGGTDGTGTAASFDTPTGLAIDRAGTLFVTEFVGNRIRRIAPDGAVTTVAGTGTAGTRDAAATAATFNGPHAIAVNDDGTLAVVEYWANRVRTVSAAGSGALAVAWTAPASTGGSPITGYLVEVRTSPSGTWTTFTTTGAAATSTTVTGLTDGTAYDVRISAVNAAGTGTATTIVAATPGTVPGAPTGLTATPGNGQLALSWTAPGSSGGSAVTDYVVQYRVSPSGAWTTFPDGTSTATTATVTSLTNGTAYDVRVLAATANGIGTASATVTATPITAPGAPTGLAATATGDRAVTVSWTAPASTGGSPITDYRVQYRVSPSGTWTTFVDGTSTATTATITGLVVGTSYDVQVAAVNPAGPGSWSSSATVQALGAWTPAELSSLTLWFDAADASTITTSGSAVSAWADKSGWSRNVSQTNPALQPTYQATGFGGLPTLDFTGDSLTATIADSTASNWTMLAAIDVDAASGLRYVFDAASGRLIAATAGGGLAPALYNDTAWVGSTAPATGRQILGWIAESTSAAATYRNGTALATGLAYPTQRAINGTVALGARNTGVDYHLDGRLSELTIVSSALTTADRQRLEGYLAWK
jgi:hypothetical protein